jgi:hypothetical protein
LGIDLKTFEQYDAFWNVVNESVIALNWLMVQRDLHSGFNSLLANPTWPEWVPKIESCEARTAASQTFHIVMELNIGRSIAFHLPQRFHEVCFPIFDPVGDNSLAASRQFDRYSLLDVRTSYREESLCTIANMLNSDLARKDVRPALRRTRALRNRIYYK